LILDAQTHTVNLFFQKKYGKVTAKDIVEYKQGSGKSFGRKRLLTSISRKKSSL
jgi:hypothetical protein